jgi:hypothetical protein
MEKNSMYQVNRTVLRVIIASMVSKEIAYSAGLARIHARTRSGEA